MATKLMIRGSTIASARDFLLLSRNEEKFDDFISSLTRDQKALIDKPIRATSWFRGEDYIGVLDRARKTIARGDPEAYLQKLGRAVVDDGVRDIYRAFFRIASPAFLIRGSALLWRLFFRGNRLKVNRTTRSSAALSIIDSATNSHSLCLSIIGGIKCCLEHSGAKDVRSEIRNCAEGRCGSCHFLFTWNRK